MAEDVVAGNAVSTPLAVRVPEACRLTGARSRSNASKMILSCPARAAVAT
jgi:hypothetical protein